MARLPSALVEVTIFEAMGGGEAVLALAEAWHRRCLADPVLAHAFEGGIHTEHTERLAAYWAEQLGGPTTYTDAMGSYSHTVRLHSGNGPHEQMDGRAVGAFMLSLDDAEIPADPELRYQLVAWFTWATAMLNHRWGGSGRGAGRSRTAALGLERHRRLVTGGRWTPARRPVAPIARQRLQTGRGVAPPIWSPASGTCAVTCRARRVGSWSALEVT